MRHGSLASFLLVLFIPIILSAWTGPTSAPPNSNVSAPVNLGSSDQVKNAGLSLNSLAVFGNTVLSGTTNYLNFGTTAGATGYGIRNNSGTLEFKNNGGAWQSLSTIIGATSWTTNGTHLYASNTGNVGVGTTSPVEKFSVTGKIYSATGGFQFPDGTVQTTAAGAGGISAITTASCTHTYGCTATCPAGYYRTGCGASPPVVDAYSNTFGGAIFGHQAVPATNGCSCSITGNNYGGYRYASVTCYAYCAR